MIKNTKETLNPNAVGCFTTLDGSMRRDIVLGEKVEGVYIPTSRLPADTDNYDPNRAVKIDKRWWVYGHFIATGSEIVLVQEGKMGNILIPHASFPITADRIRYLEMGLKVNKGEINEYQVEGTYWLVRRSS